MVRLRLRRVGRKKQAAFRIVAADKESPRDGRFLEIVGFYNPRTQPETVQLKEDRIYEWLGKGAQPSDSVERILRTAGALERWERLKKGESLEKLLEEAAAAQAARNTGRQTRHAAPVGAPKKKEEPKAEEPKAEEPAAEVEAETPAVEAEAPAAEPVEETAPEAPAAEEPAAEAEAPAEEPAEEAAPEAPAAEEPAAEAEAPAEEPAAEEAPKKKAKPKAKKAKAEDAPAAEVKEEKSEE
ncbi:MAG: 30S ribosomal protein S16 [Chloroflexi bacterium]|nr:30S ribosomal protein S16 [Chloroflexota bacterium]